jgi:predicted phosphodiesterase
MPERLALLGDIHANAPALTAVLDAIREQGLVNGACTGDLVMRGSDPDACVTAIRATGWPCVRGNTDRKVAVRHRREPDHPKAQRVGSRAWTTNQLGEANLDYLASLPLVERIPFRGLTVALMHGSPEDPRDAIDATTPDKHLARLVQELGDPDCIVSGHTHHALVRSASGCLFVNPGSVGEAVDGDLRPRWAWVDARSSGLTVHLETVDADLRTIRLP